MPWGGATDRHAGEASPGLAIEHRKTHATVVVDADATLALVVRLGDCGGVHGLLPLLVGPDGTRHHEQPDHHHPEKGEVRVCPTAAPHIPCRSARDWTSHRMPLYRPLEAMANAFHTQEYTQDIV